MARRTTEPTSVGRICLARDGEVQISVSPRRGAGTSRGKSGTPFAARPQVVVTNPKEPTHISQKLGRVGYAFALASTAPPVLWLSYFSATRHRFD